MESNNEQCSPEVCLFNIFVDEIDIGIECAFSKFADDTQYCGAVGIIEKRDAIQKDLNRI